MSLPKDEFKSTYYDSKYFADEKGKKFKRGGKTEYWGYKNPTGNFEGAKPIVKAWKTMFNPKNMLDAGAGRGQFVSMARDVGIEAEGFDFSEWAVSKGRYARCKPEWLRLHDATKTWPYKDRYFDLVTALDFYEHIYLSDLDFVISEMFRVAKKWIFLQIATVDGVKEKGYILKQGEPIPWEDGRTWAGHCTVMPPDFWIEKFECDESMLRRDMVTWFCSLVDKNIIRNWLLNTMIVLEKI
jgi:hypothetical protein